MLGWLLKSPLTVQLVIILSRQLNYNTVIGPSQAEIAKGVDSMYIFRAWITDKNGQRVYAREHGKRAFRFWVD